MISYQDSLDALQGALNKFGESAFDANVSAKKMSEVLNMLSVTEKELTNAMRQLGLRKRLLRDRIWNRIMRIENIQEGAILPKYLYWLQLFIWPVFFSRSLVMKFFDTFLITVDSKEREAYVIHAERYRSLRHVPAVRVNYQKRIPYWLGAFLGEVFMYANRNRWKR